MSELPPVTAVERLAHELREQIRSGELAHGTLLPGTQALTRLHKVSASTVSKAINQLKDEGLVVTAFRSGRAVNYPGRGAHEVPKPLTVLVGGMGRSNRELGQVLAERTQWALLDYETLTAPLINTALRYLDDFIADDAARRQHYSTLTSTANDALVRAAIQNLAYGSCSIVVAPLAEPFADLDWRRRMATAAVSVGGTIRLLWMMSESDEEGAATAQPPPFPSSVPTEPSMGPAEHGSPPPIWYVHVDRTDAASSGRQLDELVSVLRDEAGR